jgi:diguanylate cyclase (GGDEF)-like protein
LVHNLRRRLHEAEARLQWIAITDELTGLHNRRYLMQRLTAEIKRTTREQRPLACILFDLDHFKRVNDTFGHAAGDRVLQEVAATARRQCRESDILSRYGGEEFVVVLPGTDRRGARDTAERLRQAIQETSIVLNTGRTLSVSASFGVAVLDWNPGEREDVDMILLKCADDALYQAKAKGRNRVEVVDKCSLDPENNLS